MLLRSAGPSLPVGTGNGADDVGISRLAPPAGTKTPAVSSAVSSMGNAVSMRSGLEFNESGLESSLDCWRLTAPLMR